MPVLEVALVLSLFFTVPIASVTLDVVSTMQSRGHRHLSLNSMIEMAVARRQEGADLLKRDHAARVRRQVMQAIEAGETPEFLTSDPHDPMLETSDPHDPGAAR